MDKIVLAEDRLNRMNNTVLTDFWDAGMLRDEGYDELTKAGHRYSPLQREQFLNEIESGAIPAGGRSFNIREQGVVKASGPGGSDLKVLPATESLLRNWERMRAVAGKNRVTSRIGALAERPEFQGVVRPFQEGMPIDEAADGVISAFVKGHRQDFVVPKPVAEAVQGMRASDADLLGKWMQATNQLMVQGSTKLNPAFVGRNVVRDYRMATLKSADQGMVFTPMDWLKGFWSAAKKDNFYDQYLASGGSMSGFFERGAGRAPATINRLTGNEPIAKKLARGAWNAIGKPAELTELAPRVGYMRMLEQARLKGMHMPLETMGNLTRNATVDYGKSGAAPGLQQARLWIPMLNARIQGLANTASSIKNHPGRSAAVVTALAGVPTVATYFHNVQSFPEVWADIPQEVKDRAHIVIHSNRKDENGDYPDVTMIPKDDIWGAFSNALEYSLDAYRGADPRGFAKMATQMVSDLSPVEFAKKGEPSKHAVASSLLPPVVKAVAVEPLANRNLFTEREILNEREQQIDPKEAFRTTTPEWLVTAGKTTGIAPLMIQNAISTQFGAVGRMAAGDVRPGRDATEERTGIGALKRTFIGARGGAIEGRKQDIRQENNRTVRTESYVRDRKSQHALEGAKALPTEQRRGYLQKELSGADERQAESFIDKAVRDAKGMTPYERGLHSDPIESRAMTILAEVEAMKPQERQARLERLHDIGVLTEDVASKMAEIYTNRKSAGRTNDSGLSPLDRALGVAPLALPPRQLSPLDKALGVK
jgi:hypothetical protein